MPHSDLEVNRAYKREWARKWRKQNPDKVKASSKRYCAKNVEKLRERRRAWWKKNYVPSTRVVKTREQVLADKRTYGQSERGRLMHRNWIMRNYYGITLAEYESLVHKCGGLCQICGKPPSGPRKADNILAVDHDHATGAARGLLCGKCNKGLGLFGDNPALFVKASEYLGRKVGLTADTGGQHHG